MLNLVPLVLLVLLGLGLYLLLRSAVPCLPRVVCLGDSLTACGGPGGRYSDYLAAALPECEVINRGLGGDTLRGGRVRFERDVLALKPAVLVLELGANDFWQRRSMDDFRADMEWMVQQAQANQIPVVLAGVMGEQTDEKGNTIPKQHLPGASAELGRQILTLERELARQYGCQHVENIQADLNCAECWDNTRHPSAAGNERVAARLLPKVREALKRSAKGQGSRV